jgi:hypothetical protein
MASSSAANRKRMPSKTKAKTTKAKSMRPVPKRKVSKAKSNAAAPKYKRVSSPAAKSKTSSEGKAVMAYTPAPNRKRKSTLFTTPHHHHQPSLLSFWPSRA